MNCEQYQRSIGDALADGEAVLSAELAAHLRSCGECGEFYEAQQRLLAAIHTGVRAMVNEAVPASLLPRVRARVEEAPLPRFVWKPAWSVVAAAAVLVAASIAFAPWRKPVHKVAGMNDSTAVAEAGETQDAILAPGTVPVNSRRGPGHAMTAAKERPEEAPEVIVLAEEREAFGRFVAKVPENPQKAVALTHAAAVQQDLPVEIALLQIERLKVDLLEPAAEE